MDYDLPFKYCNNDEIFDIFSTENSIKQPVHEIRMTSVILAQNLPFYKCSDFAMLTECLTNKERFLDFFENNNFTSEHKNIIEGLSTEKFSCKYYNENNFNSMVPKQHACSSLKLFHQNIRSLNKNCHQLKAFLSCLKCEFDVLLFTEIGHSDKQLIEEVFENYTFYFDHSKSKKGGAGILIRNDCYDEIEISDDKLILDCNCSNCIVESIFINIKSNNITHTVGAIYRHPSGKIAHFNESLNKCLKKFNSNNLFVIAGDINIVLLKTNIQSTQDYLNTMLSYNLIPSMVIPTRITDKSMTLIDHIFVRLPKSKINNKITSGNFITDISDHLSNFAIIDIEVKRSTERPLIRLFTKKNIEKFERNISSEFSNLTEQLNIDGNTNVNEIYKILYDKLHSLLDLYFPKVRLSHKKAKDKDWITLGIKRAIRQRNKLFHIQLKYGTEKNIKKWKTYRNILNKIIKNAQKDYYQHLIKQHNNSCTG